MMLVLLLAASAADETLALRPTPSSLRLRQPSRPSLHHLRGGASPVASLADFSDAASSLFNNMRTPAAIVGGSIVPMGFVLAAESADETPLVRKLRQLYSLIAVASFTSQLIAVIYSSIAVNKLAEVAVPPTKNVFELLNGPDYQLPWIGCNVHFILGLFGIIAMVGIKTFVGAGATIGAISSCIVASALALMLSIINRGVAVGDGSSRLGGNLGALLLLYGRLVLTELVRSKGVLQAASLAFAAAAVTLSIRRSPA